jgi:methyl-accepting chemotaxis protein
MLIEIINSVKRVTDVVAAIALSSREQASGIELVNKAVAIMDSGTQQNGALVEQASAAAQALTEQAEALTQLIARYNVGGDHTMPNTHAASPNTHAASPNTHAASPSAPLNTATLKADARRATRPWSGRPKTNAPAQTSGADARKRVAAAQDDWKDF